MKKLKSKKIASTCCALLLLHAAAAAALDSTALLPNKKNLAASENALQALRISKKMGKDIAPFVDATGCSVRVVMYAEKAAEDGEEDDLFNIATFIKKIALKKSANLPQDAPLIAIQVGWAVEKSGKYDANATTAQVGELSSLFSENALAAFSKKIVGYEEKPPIDSIKDTKVDAQIVAALSTLKKSVNLLEYKTGNVQAAAKAAIGDATSSQGETAAACNICVRAAVWHVAASSVLFPNHGGFIGNTQSSYLYGRISKFDHRYPTSKDYIGTANSIAASLEEKGVVPELVAVPNMPGIEIPDFKQLQRWANSGQIIVGVLKGAENSSGHVVMMVPYSADIENDKVYTYKDILVSNIKYLMPQILECGEGRREEVYPLQKGVSSKKIKNMKWYRMVGTYTSPQNKVK